MSKEMNYSLSSIIKILSCAFIAIALGLTVGQIYSTIADRPLPHILEILFWIGSFVLFSHLIEGIVAFTIAYRRGENPIRAGIYTFWTGAVGLWEINNTYNEGKGGQKNN